MSGDNTVRRPEHEEVTDVQTVNQQPENLPAIPEKAAPPVAVQNRYGTASSLKITERESGILAAPVNVEAEAEVRPDGLVFMPQVFYRRRLNQAFGPGQWALMPVSDWRRDGNHLYREYALIVRGCFVAESMGEAEYQETNDNMTWGDATEAVKSDALKRCCKDLGIGSECWDRRFTDSFLVNHCVRVHRSKQKNPRYAWAWRRKDAPPFYDEDGQASGIAQPQRKSESQSKAQDPTAAEVAEMDRREKEAAEREAAEVASQQDAAADQGAWVDQEGNWIAGTVEFLNEKSGTGKRGAWKKVGTKINGHWVNAFDTKIQDALREAKETGRRIKIRVERDDYGLKALEVRFS